MCACAYDVFTEALADPGQRSKYLYTLGDFDGAAASFAEVQGTYEQEAWALFDQGKALRAGGRAGQAIPLLEEAAASLPQSLWPPLILALALAEQGDFNSARAHLEQARDLEPSNGWVRFLYHGRHINLAEAHVQQGDYVLAARDYEAPLMLDPDNVITHTGYAAALALSGQRIRAQHALNACTGNAARRGRQYSEACIKLAEQHLTHQEIGPANACLSKREGTIPTTRRL